MNAERKERRKYAAIPSDISARERNVFGSFKAWLVGLFQRQPELADRLIEAKLGQEESGRSKTAAEAEKLESEAELIRVQTQEKLLDIARKELELESEQLRIVDTKLSMIEKHFPGLPTQVRDQLKLNILRNNKMADAIVALSDQIDLIESKGGTVEVFSRDVPHQKPQETIGTFNDEQQE